MTRLLIAGCRDFTDYEKFCKIVDEHMKLLYLHPENATIISGGAPGTDSMAKRYADEKGYYCFEFFANWQLGKRAGPIRNAEMADNCDKALIFWDSTSKGTKNMLSHLNDLNIPTSIKYIGGKE